MGQLPCQGFFLCLRKTVVFCTEGRHRFRRFFPVKDIHPFFVHPDAFAELVQAAVFAVVVQIHPNGLAVPHPQSAGHFVGHGIPQMRSVVPVGQQNPVFVLPHAEQVCFRVQLQLERTLFLMGRGIAPELDAAAAVIFRFSIRRHQLYLRRLCRGFGQAVVAGAAVNVQRSHTGRHPAQPNIPESRIP